MQSFVIVPGVDEGNQRAMTGRVCGKVRVVQPFPLQRREKTFRDRVVPTIAPPIHARDAVRVRDRRAVVVTRIRPGFNWSSQHYRLDVIATVDGVLRPACASRAFCVAAYSG